MKKGISLIVLVITIIVMIILAASVVITLSNTGVINKSSEAVDKTDYAQVQHYASLIWADEYMANKRGETLKESVLGKLEDYKDKYDFDVTDNGITVTQKGEVKVPEEWKASVSELTSDGVPIPKGFIKSPYPNEGSKDKGLVIYALTEAEIAEGKTTITDTHQTALETRNQFVWVPVDSEQFETLFVRNNFGYGDRLSTTNGKNYWEIEVDGNNMPLLEQSDNNSLVSDATIAEASAMYASVKKYGGFYIARYEAGMPTYEAEPNKVILNGYTYGQLTTRVYLSDGSNKNLMVAMNKYPYNCVPWGTSMSNENMDGGAVSLARNFYPANETTYGVVSTLTYSVQFDRILAWYIENGVTRVPGVYYNVAISEADMNVGAQCSVVESYLYTPWTSITSKAENVNMILTTGAYKKAGILNIYDISGNLYECTMEGDSNGYHSFRGSAYNYFETDSIAYTRTSGSPDYPNSTSTFRPALYIK